MTILIYRIIEVPFPDGTVRFEVQDNRYGTFSLTHETFNTDECGYWPTLEIAKANLDSVLKNRKQREEPKVVHTVTVKV